MKISVCIPYYNRSEMVMETIIPLLIDSRIDEIILCDDCSPKKDFINLLSNTEGLDKIRIVKNVINHHNQHNKRNALSFAKNEWVLLLDNDNVAKKDFIDSFFNTINMNGHPNPKIIYHPAFASPLYDYRQLNGHFISKNNANIYCRHTFFVTLCNTNNYFVNRDEYLRVYKHDNTVRGADGIYFAYQWLKSGNSLFIVPNMQYFHRVHEGSEFLREVESNMKLIYYYLELIKQLK
jgi:glycosyltransferase involved in cell wall biosynthesis